MRQEAKTPNRRWTRSCAMISKAFCTRCVLHLNPGAAFLPNWHIKAIAYQLDRIRRGEITRLIINMPPRYLKSLTVTVAFTAFLLGHEPWRKIFAISYGDDLSAKHASDFRSIVHSPWFKRAFRKMQIIAQRGWRISHNKTRLSQVDLGIGAVDWPRRRLVHYRRPAEAGRCAI